MTTVRAAGIAAIVVIALIGVRKLDASWLDISIVAVMAAAAIVVCLRLTSTGSNR